MSDRAENVRAAGDGAGRILRPWRLVIALVLALFVLFAVPGMLVRLGSRRRIQETRTRTPSEHHQVDLGPRRWMRSCCVCRRRSSPNWAPSTAGRWPRRSASRGVMS